MSDKESIEALKDGGCYIVPESDYGKAEIWRKNDKYFLFEIPTFGGNPVYSGAYAMNRIDEMIRQYDSWT